MLPLRSVHRLLFAYFLPTKQRPSFEMEMSDESVSRTNVRPLSGSVKTDESVSRASVRPLSESAKTDEACPEQAFVRCPEV